MYCDYHITYEMVVKKEKIINKDLRELMFSLSFFAILTFPIIERYERRYHYEEKRILGFVVRFYVNNYDRRLMAHMDINTIS